MAETKLNVYQKLAKARVEFLDAKVKKSGKNMHLEFKYFELDDIVPVATRIFDRLGLIAVPRFQDGEDATMTVINADEPMEEVVFHIPFRENAPRYNKDGAEISDRLQLLGMSLTYLKRYLWMAVLDITEPDETEPSLGKKEEAAPEFAEEKAEAKKKAKKSSAKPVAPAEKAEIKKALTADDDRPATEDEIAVLKSVCKELLSKDAEQEDLITKIGLKTKGFTDIKKSIYDQLLSQLREMVAGYQEVKANEVEQ